ncbi:hypothetical protein GCM10027422_43260 [Hymenobacter arcticus]
MSPTYYSLQPNADRYLANVVVISLASRADRRAQMRAELLAQGLPFRFHDALPGPDNPRRACAQSHAAALTNFLAAPAEYLLLLEDDCVFAADFRHRFDGLDLGTWWQQLRLGALHVEPPLALSPGVFCATRALDTHACVYTRVGAARALWAILDGLQRWPADPLDVWLLRDMENVPTLALYPALARQRLGRSDITGTTYCNYNEDGTQRWMAEVMRPRTAEVAG